jgi:hypothetical protein
MSIRSKVLAVAATLTLVSGVGAAGTLTAAHAATPSCGDDCIDVFSHQFGTHFKPNYLVDVLRQGQKVGQPIILFRSSNTDPALDFTISDLDVCGNVDVPSTDEGACAASDTDPMTVAELAALDPGLIPNAVLVRYGSFLVYENEYSPFGVNSGLCMGVAATPFNNEGVTLQPCGVSAKTLWIVDKLEHETFDFGYVPLINAASPTFTHPYVLTYPQNGFPTDMPRPQLTVHTLQTYSNGFPHVFTSQLWGADFGAIP